MKLILSIFLLLNVYGSGLFAQSYISKDSVFQRAVREEKSVFILFSGSDWCANCIRFEKKVLADPGFQEFLYANVLFLNADFPQRKKLNKELTAQNEQLAEQYNPGGIFPTLLLVAPDKKITLLLYEEETAAQFIDKMKKALHTFKQND